MTDSIDVMASERECLGDLTEYHPKRGIRVFKDGVQIAWHRGRQYEAFELYKKLRRKYPEAAAYILTLKHMDKQGNVTL